MYNATLIYRIPCDNEVFDLKLENRPLFSIDRITSSFKDDVDFINHYYNKEEVFEFIKKCGYKAGKLLIEYTKDVNRKKELQPLYDKEPLFLNEDFYMNHITELEKARKLLFNSKNQLFTKLVLQSDVFGPELNRMIDLNAIESKYAINNNIDVKLVNNKNYVFFKSLLQYRIDNNKLGLLRNAYQDMLDVLKAKIEEKDRNTFYYYNRELRLLINRYQELINQPAVKHLKVEDYNKKRNYILCKSKWV